VLSLITRGGEPAGRESRSARISASTATDQLSQTWVLGGSTNGTTWTTIHVQPNASLAYSTSYTYSVSPGEAFAYYRFIITQNGKNDWAGFTSLQLFA
jgi:hypothetical protein